MKLDVRGEFCPYPSLEAVKAMKSALPGEVIEVYTDHAPALETIPTQAKRLGFTVTIDEMGPTEWKITLTKATEA